VGRVTAPQSLGGWRARLPDIAALGLLALLTLVFFWPVTLRLGWIPAGGGDLVSFLWPTYSYAADALRTGRLPLWNHSLYAGAPLAADNQSGLFYPLNLLVFYLWPGLPFQALEWLVIGHVWLAGAGMYALMRLLLAEMAAGPRAKIAEALAAACAFMFSDIFVTHVGNLNIIAVSAWLPWAAAALSRGLVRRSAGWAAAAGAALGAATLAGHAQMTLVIGLGLGLMGAWWAVEAWREQAPTRRGNAWLAPVGLLALTFGVAFGLSAVSVIPALELTGYTGRARLDYAAAAEYSLPWQGLAGWVSPLIFGRGAEHFWAPWGRVGLGYAGVVTLWLAGLAPWRGQAGRGPRALAVVGVLGLLLALGEHTPVHRLFHAVAPGFASLRVPARFILLSDFAVAGLAAYGLARLPSLPARRVLAWTLGLSAAALAVCLAAWLSVPGQAEHGSGLLWGLGVAATLLATAAGLALTRLRMKAALIAFLIAGDLLGHGAWVEVERDDPTRGFEHRAVVEYLRSQPGPVRMDNVSAAWSPDAAARHGLEDIGGISNPLALAAYQTYLGAVGPRGSPLYNFLNAQFVVSDKGRPPGDSRLAPVFADDPTLDVYLNTVAEPRIRLVYEAQTAASGEAAFGALHAPGFDPARMVVLEAATPAAPPALPPAPPAAAESNLFYLAYAPEAYTVVARTSGPAYLVYSETWYPGWRAWVNGAMAPIYRANFAFRAVYLPGAGEHVVEMRFDPPAFGAGLGLTLATLVGLGLLGVRGPRARRRVGPARAGLRTPR
jgi:hypothetical protein